jgi:hypothetical protein
MNGRVYDPNLGRFLSVDPMIESLAIAEFSLAVCT